MVIKRNHGRCSCQ